MKSAKLQYIIALLIFGSMGLFIRNLPFTSGQIAMARGIVGTLFLFTAGVLIQKNVSWFRIKKNMTPLLIAGAALGFNWILLFQAYQYTTISIATICYYFAPVLVMFLSPLILKERLTAARTGCILAAMAGMLCIVGLGGGGSLLGIGYGLSAAIFYAVIVISNKFLKEISGMESSLIQLAVSAVCLLPYILITDGFSLAGATTGTISLLLTVGILHTGVAYYLYFSALRKLSAQTAAVLSYLDPLSAILMAGIILHESMTVYQAAGGILVLGAALVNEITGNRRQEEVNRKTAEHQERYERRDRRI